MSDEAIMLKSIARALKEIVIQLEEMNDRAEKAERKELALHVGTMGFSLGSPDIPESCPKEMRWAGPAAAEPCNTCRRFWSCPFSSPAQDPKGGK